MGALVRSLLAVALACISCVVIAAGSPASASSVAYAAGPGDGPLVTRSAAILTADRFARVRWTMSETNRTGTACGGGFQSPYPIGKRIGMAYRWGGWDPVDEFLRKIDEGYGAGTGGGADTYDRFPRECVTGTSCAGLVSRAWQLEHKYTLDYADPRIQRKLGEITHAVPGVDPARGVAGDLRKGDAFISSTHVMLFVYETRDHRAMILDARLPGVAFRSISWDWIARNGYQAIRYNNIRDDDEPMGTRDRPIAIGPRAPLILSTPGASSTTGPWIYEGNTRDVVAMAFDRYSVAPGIRQQGPEMVYSLTLESPATVTLRLTDFVDEGIDNDLHLLTSLRVDETRTAIDCLARGDRSIRLTLEPGTYFVVVDSGADLPGEYTLRVEID
jgi:hypothetical protein